MKKIITYLLVFLLSFTLVNGVHAQSPQDLSKNTVVQVVDDTVFTITTEGNIITTVVNEGNNTDKAVYNMETGEIFVNDVKLSNEQTEFFVDLGNTIDSNTSDSITLESNTLVNSRDAITPLADQDPGVGGGIWTWVSTKGSSINLVGLTVGGISAALVAIFSAGTLGLFATGMATTISSNIGVAGGTIYYSWTKWTRPDPQWPVLFKARWDNIKFYKNSNNTGYIKEWDLYN